MSSVPVKPDLQPEQQVLQRMDAARQALAEAVTFSEVKTLHSGIESIREWLRQQKECGLEITNDAAVLRLEAERRMGEMLSRGEVVKVTDGRPKKPSSSVTVSDVKPSSSVTVSPPTHSQIGVDRQTAKRYRDVASVSSETIRQLATEATGRGEELTRARLMKLARKETQPEKAATPALPDGFYDVIYADPPWQTNFRRGDTRDVENHYPTLSFGEICQLPVPPLVPRNCVLFLWATSPLLDQALDVLKVWEFTYKTSAIWVKSGMGMGYYFRQDHEILLIGTRGRPSVPEASDRISSVVQAVKTRHSEKPPVFYEIIESMYPNARRLELFARGEERPGWTFWGNEIKKGTKNEGQ